MLYTQRYLVTMADVDAAGIIYFASPLRWAENAYTNWMHGLGHPHRQLFSEGIATPTVNVTVDYHSHLNLDDEIRLVLTTARIGTTSFTLRLQALAEPQGDLAPQLGETAAAVDVRTTHVFARYAHPSYGAEAGTTKEALPEWLRAALKADCPRLSHTDARRLNLCVKV